MNALGKEELERLKVSSQERKRKIIEINDGLLDNDPKKRKFLVDDPDKQMFISYFGLRSEICDDVLSFLCCADEKCSSKIKITSGTTSNVLRHLEKQHSIQNPSEVSVQRREQFQENAFIQNNSYATYAAQEGVDEARYGDLLRALVTIKRMLPFNHFEDHTVRLLSAGMHILSNKKTKQLLLEYYLAFMSKVSKSISANILAIPSVHLMFDIWQEAITARKFFGLRIGYVDSQFLLKSYLVCLVHYFPSYQSRMDTRAAQLLKQLIVTVLEMLKIPLCSVASATTDKGSDVYSCVRTVMKLDHFWCHSHMLDRCLRAAIGRKSPVAAFLQTIRDTLTLIRSPIATAYYHTIPSASHLKRDVWCRKCSLGVLEECCTISFTATRSESYLKTYLFRVISTNYGFF